MNPYKDLKKKQTENLTSKKQKNIEEYIIPMVWSIN